MASQASLVSQDYALRHADLYVLLVDHTEFCSLEPGVFSNKLIEMLGPVRKKNDEITWSTITTNQGSNRIAALQGFFIRSTGIDTLKLNNNHRTVDTTFSTTFFRKAPVSAMKIKVDFNGKSDGQVAVKAGDDAIAANVVGAADVAAGDFFFLLCW